MGFSACKIGSDAALVVVRGVYFDGLDCKGFLCVLREHGHQDIIDNFGFRLVRRCNINEDITCFGTYFGMVGVDYWGHGADCPVGVEDDRIYWGVSNDVEVSREVLVVLLKG